MQNYIAIIFAAFLITGFGSLGLTSNILTVAALPLDFLDKTYVFGPIAGVAEDKNGTISWVLAGVWRSSLPSSNDTSGNDTGASFNAAIEMVRPDGSGRHTHTITDFTLLNSSSQTDTNSTFYNGTSTVSLKDGPALDIPTSIKFSNNNILTIWMDPKSIEAHFGELPSIFGIVESPEFDLSIYDQVSMTNGTNHSTLAH